MEIQWSLVFFTLLTGFGVGIFSCVAIIEWLGIAKSLCLPGAVTAIMSLGIAGLVSLIHPSHPSRMRHIFKHLDTGIGIEMLLANITGASILGYIITLFLGAADQLAIVFASLGLVSGICLAVATGSAYILPARPAWNTWFWPFVHITSAAVTGIFAVYVWAAIFQDQIGRNVIMNINRAALAALIFHAAAIAAYIVFLNESPYKDPSRSPSRILRGDLAWPFWMGLVLGGIILPLGLTIYLQILQTVHLALPVAILGLAGTLVGGTTIRALMFVLGSEADPTW